MDLDKQPIQFCKTFNKSKQLLDIKLHSLHVCLLLPWGRYDHGLWSWENGNEENRFIKIQKQLDKSYQLEYIICNDITYIFKFNKIW